jgi:hypothetical protein
MRRTSLTAAQLLHGLVLDTDSFLPNPICFLDSPLYRPRLFYRRSEYFGANRPATDSAAADLILSHALARREVRALRVHATEVPRKSQQEKIMKYLLLIAALITLTAATSISSSEAGCCSGGACCPSACCMMTR